MESVLIVITLVSLAMTIALGAILARLMRDERRRSAARVAVLREMADAAAREQQRSMRPSPAERASHDRRRPDAGAQTTIQPPADLFVRPEPRSAWPRRLAIAAAIVLIVTVVSGRAALEIDAGRHRGPARRLGRRQRRRRASSNCCRSSNAGTERAHDHRPRAEPPRRGRAVEGQRDGAPLRPRRHVPGERTRGARLHRASPRRRVGFVINVPVTTPVARYRVGFRSEDGRVIGHIDRRTAATMASGREPVPVAAPGNIMSRRSRR